MLKKRPSAARGRSKIDWLDSYHTFSFADYHDDEWMGYRDLRVINDDTVAPGAGFPMHPHRNMEIVTIILKGALAHKDSLGTGSTIRPGDIQRMSAGKGILHSEFNPSETEPVHLLQIWILPRENGRLPSYDQKTIDPAAMAGRFALVASGTAANSNAISLGQDVNIHMATLKAGESASYSLPKGRHGWLHVAEGQTEIQNADWNQGDSGSWSDDESISVKAKSDSTIVLFDLM